MANQGRGTSSYLIEHLVNEAFRYDFFHLLWLLELLYPDLKKIGYDGPPGIENVRLQSSASFDFPASQIAHFKPQPNKNLPPFLVANNFFGLYGRHGVLPWHYTQLIIKQAKQKEYNLRAFFDIFNHRLLSFFYRAGIKYRYPLIFRHQGKDRQTPLFNGFLGLGTRHLKNRFPYPDTALFRYIGLFIQPHSASSLSILLKDFLQVPIAIKQFQGEWLFIDKDNQNRIGRFGANHQIGTGFTIGRRIWSRQHKFRIVLGPLTFKQFTLFLPSQKGFKHLVHLVRLFVGAAFIFDIQLFIDRRYIPGMVLGSRDTQLGHATWTLMKSTNQGITNPIFTIKE